jgi:hypothetical protein
MKYICISILSLLLLLSGCITQFTPQTTEDKQMLVVESLITNQPDINFVRLSKSTPLGSKSTATPVSGCSVSVTDDHGGTFPLVETKAGTYAVSSGFQGIKGWFYTLHISSGVDNNNLQYESLPMELKSSPPIDSIYYEKVLIATSPQGIPSEQGCNVFLDTHDPENKCKFYRWEFSETWEFHLPYTVPNAICWLTENSDIINIKNVSVLAENKVSKYNINYISNETDRLSFKYSMLVHQFAMNEDEYSYWEKLENISEQVGGLYDMIPAAIPSNVFCVNNPNESVLGYFSVSGTSSKRVFIKDHFAGIQSPYTTAVCVSDTLFNGETVPNMGSFVWVIVDHPLPPPSYQVITRIKGCYDCTLRGTNVEPAFWHENKSQVIDENK